MATTKLDAVVMELMRYPAGSPQEQARALFNAIGNTVEVTCGKEPQETQVERFTHLLNEQKGQHPEIATLLAKWEKYFPYNSRFEGFEAPEGWLDETWDGE